MFSRQNPQIGELCSTENPRLGKSTNIEPLIRGGLLYFIFYFGMAEIPEEQNTLTFLEIVLYLTSNQTVVYCFKRVK